MYQKNSMAMSVAVSSSNRVVFVDDIWDWIQKFEPVNETQIVLSGFVETVATVVKFGWNNAEAVANAAESVADITKCTSIVGSCFR